MPARYLAEGHQAGHQSPNPNNSNARQAPTLYSAYGYAFPGSFMYNDPGAPARIPRKSCRCSHRCTCDAGAEKAHQQSAEVPPPIWRKQDYDYTNFTKTSESAATPALPGFHRGDYSRPATMSASPPGSLSLPPPKAPLPAVNLPPPASKRSDWENLLGAVDLELRAQRAELSPEPPARVSVSLYNAPTGRAPLLPSVGGDNHCKSSAASISPELGPYKPTHRRGGNIVSGGGPAYSGSTADAASLLATLPQRMLDRASSKAGASAVGVMPSSVPSSPNLVAVANSPPPAAATVQQPIRVQASGRRGPRGQSRFKGVCITRAGKWRAVIYIGRKQKYLGVFDSEFDAARAYDAAALQHFAEGAKLNFPDGIEQQLNNLSSGGTGTPFATAGAGGGAASRASTPPSSTEGNSSTGRKRSRKSTFGDHNEGEWVRRNGPWNSSNSSSSRR